MNLFGYEISISKAVQSISARAGSWWRVMEPFSGAFQRNVEVRRESVLAYHAVFSCMTLIARDVAKLRLKLVERDKDGIWTETESPAYSPVLRKPNPYQTRNQFWETWLLSKLSTGNTYALKRRDGRGVVTAMYVLDPARCRPMVSDHDGAVWYELRSDNLTGIDEDTITVPASEIIHDRFNCLFHALVGISPIYACGLAATQGLAMQNQSTLLFQNGARPGGILVAPGSIDPDNAGRLKDYWDNNFTGDNSGKIAVLGDGLKYEALATSAVDAQMIEQLKWTSEVVASTFHVPPYKIGVGEMPSYNNIQSLNVEYYSQCLQSLMEDIETVLDEGLGTGTDMGTEFDLDNLLRMDAVTQMQVLKDSSGILSPNEQRAKLDKKPVTGGSSPMLQQQNFSLEALAKRDASADPFATGAATNDNSADPAPSPDDADPAGTADQTERAFAALMKGLA